MVNRNNGLINIVIPLGYQIWLTDPIRHVLGLEDSGWLEAEYDGDSAVEFSPKRILVYLRQLSTTNNLLNNNQKLVSSQILSIIPMSTKSFGESFTINFENPHFRFLQTNNAINELDFDFKVEWGNGVQHKLDNHEQPIDLVLEIK